MSKKRRKKSKFMNGEELPRLNLAPHTKRAIFIIIFLLSGVLVLLSLFGSAGSLGELISRLFDLLFGWGAMITPLVFFAVAVALFVSGRKADEEGEEGHGLRIYLGAILFVFAFTGLLHSVAMKGGADGAFDLVQQERGGGYFGALAAFAFMNLIDFWASVAVFVAAILVSMLLVFPFSISEIIQAMSRFREKRREVSSRDDQRDSKDVKINQMETAGFSSMGVDDSSGDDESDEDGDSDQVEAKPPQIKSFEDNSGEEIDYELSKERYRKANWELPSIAFLEDSHSTVDSGNIEANVNIIQKTLADFGIPVEMSEVNVGPTVTQYTLRPAQGIKLSQIISLQNDLALALAAPSIRIEAPIPGRSLVGIEVPNKANAIVRLKDIVKTEDFLKHKSGLAFALGRDVAGHAMVADLQKMPHLLVAGATGAGKSVGINSLMISLLFRNSPEELRMIVIDPKRVELNLYNGIPHLLTPVVTDHSKAVNALKWAVNEMDRRYELLAEHSCRNIGEYNNQNSREKMPFIVIIVDELADLMAVAQADVEAAVVRLAQMARAVGVHLVLATQRPSVDIITGLIKANITARVAYAVASQVDSRTILDSSGAEKLLGSGDMLFITSEFNKPRRVQGTYISEKEVKGVVGFVKEQAGEVEYSEEILEKQRVSFSVPGFDNLDGDDDDMLPEAIDEVRRARKASASLLQRRLRVGYARAARLLDIMEEKGIVGPADGAKPREVYLDSEDTFDN